MFGWSEESARRESSAGAPSGVLLSRLGWLWQLSVARNGKVMLMSGEYSIERSLLSPNTANYRDNTITLKLIETVPWITIVNNLAEIFHSSNKLILFSLIGAWWATLVGWLGWRHHNAWTELVESSDWLLHCQSQYGPVRLVGEDSLPANTGLWTVVRTFTYHAVSRTPPVSASPHTHHSHQPAQLCWTEERRGSDLHFTDQTHIRN